MSQVEDLNGVVQEHNKMFGRIREEIGKVIIGQHRLIDRLLIALLADGHLLLEGLPGLAKTLTVRTLASVMQCDFQRIQFTPDLLPSDLLGTSIYNPKEGTFSVRKGPVFTNLVLADEINRAPAKVQSALLEVMGERQVTVGGETFQAGDPFLVLATQNPIEQEGTYRLPEAQTDRFMMKVTLTYPQREEEREILLKMSSLHRFPCVEAIADPESLRLAKEVVDEIYVDERLLDYLLDIVFATRDPAAFSIPISRWIEVGASPRASLALIRACRAHAFLSGRGFVTPYDVQEVGVDVLAHRIHLSYEGEAQGASSKGVVRTILETLPVP